MNKDFQAVGNLLTLIAIFAGLSETTTTAALPMLHSDLQAISIWFVMGFPLFLVIIFFLTLNFNRVAIYGPDDYKDKNSFDRIHMAKFSTDKGQVDNPSAREVLNNFWKPNGNLNHKNQSRLRDWMKENGLGEEIITFFIRSMAYGKERAQAVKDLGLSFS